MRLRGKTAAWALMSAAAAAIAPQAAADDQMTYEGTTAQQQLSFRHWDQADGPASGWQLFAPFTATAAVKFGPHAALDVNLRSGWVIADYREPGLKGHVATWTDTVAGLDWTFPGLWGDEALVPYLSWDFNLPTGRATLYGDQKLALMDPDLVDLVRFGEGFNVNMVAGASYALDENWTITLGAGFNWRGAYTPDGDTGFEYKPGDQGQGIAAIQYIDDAMLVSLNVKYFDETMATLDAADYFDPGDRIDVTARGIFSIDESSSLSATVLYSKSQKNRYLNFFSGVVETEPFNGNGAVWFAQLSYSHRFDALTVTGYGTYRKREKNDFDPINDLFIPARSQWSIGATATYEIEEGASINGGASFGRLRDDATAFTGANRDTNTFTLTLSGQIDF